MPDAVVLLNWTDWVPLNDRARFAALIPALPGLYRVRRIGRNDLDYIGQTGAGGMTHRKRLAMLRGIYADEMPYRDPHTAAPALWALRQETGCDFEISVVPVVGSTPWRKGLEALAIALYRQENGHSPTVEFGRMPTGYRASSSYNRRILDQGRVFRGGAWTETLDAHASGIPPVGPLNGDPHSLEWGGHEWSNWVPLALLLERTALGSGLYRLRGDGERALLYVGQGSLPARPLAHLAKMQSINDPQGTVFGGQDRLEVSWVLSDQWLPHQRLELENDLIAAHVLTTEENPAAQFLGKPVAHKG